MTPLPIVQKLRAFELGSPGMVSVKAHAELGHEAADVLEALVEALAMFADAAAPRGPDGHHEMPRFPASEIARADAALAKARGQ